ncbi:uncharacterized protein [Miscanthus floridulus]|uniref:uncharacterized protein n=1 Tax=Miscanthus floridulus TaxID=154761 RepID=UPI0034591A86
MGAPRATCSPEEVSASTVAATAVGTRHHLLKLEGYSLLKTTHAKSGSYIESSAFKVGGHTWRIRCYLNGNSKEYPGFVSLFLVEDLERSSFLQDDCFAVRCTVTVVQERTVKEKAVQAHDMARLGILCKCDDDVCKRHHARPAETFLERFANFCYSICRGPVRIMQ